MTLYKSNYELKTNQSNSLVNSPYFNTNILKITGSSERDYTPFYSFVIYICVKGVLNIANNNRTRINLIVTSKNKFCET